MAGDQKRLFFSANIQYLFKYPVLFMSFIKMLEITKAQNYPFDTTINELYWKVSESLNRLHGGTYAGETEIHASLCALQMS